MTTTVAPETRIDRRFRALKRAGRAAFVSFITAGDPDPATSAEILAGLPAAGADVIEVGMPFSDPMADGPAIQASSLRALKGGQTLRKTLAMLGQTWARIAIPFVGKWHPVAKDIGP